MPPPSLAPPCPPSSGSAGTRRDESSRLLATLTAARLRRCSESSQVESEMRKWSPCQRSPASKYSQSAIRLIGRGTPGIPALVTGGRKTLPGWYEAQEIARRKPSQPPVGEESRICGCRDASSRGRVERFVVASDREGVAAAQTSRQTGREVQPKSAASAFLQESKASTPSPKMARQSFLQERVWQDCIL